MTECESKIVLSRSKKRKVELEFGGGDITSDGGVSLLGLADKRLNLTKRLASFLTDPRDQNMTRYPSTVRLENCLHGNAYIMSIPIRVKRITRREFVVGFDPCTVLFRWQ